MCRLQLPSRVKRRVNRINKHWGIPIMLCMNPRRQPWSSSSRNNNDIQNIIIFQLIMQDCTFLKCGVQQTICFKPLAHRSVKLTFSCSLAVTLTLTTHVRMCVYINECSVILKPTVIKNILKMDMYILFCLKIC